MRRPRHMIVALATMLAVAAFTAVSASAAFLLAEWLLNGVAITSNDLVEIQGELLLEDTGAPARPDVLCSGYSNGWVGPNSLGWISEVLNLNHETVSSAKPLLCALDVRSSCESSTETVDVVPLGLPAELEVVLLEQTGGPFFAVRGFKAGGGTGGWETKNCLVFGLPLTDKCTSEEGAVMLTLNGTTLEGSASEEFLVLMGGTEANCTASSTEHTGVITGGGSIVPSGGGELTASSEKLIA